MRTIIQRVTQASVTVNNDIVGQIKHGLLLLVGFTHDDTIDDINYIINKIIDLRIFDDQDGKINLAINDVKGSILSVSQFTLYADVKKGRRPSFDKALGYNDANNLYQLFNETLRAKGLLVETGIFGGNMKVSLINDGPLTIIIDSKE